MQRIFVGVFLAAIVLLCSACQTDTKHVPMLKTNSSSLIVEEQTVLQQGVPYSSPGVSLLHQEVKDSSGKTTRDFYLMLASYPPTSNAPASGVFGQGTPPESDECPVFRLDSGVAYFLSYPNGWPIGRTKRVTGGSRGTHYIIQVVDPTRDRIVKIDGEKLYVWVGSDYANRIELADGMYVDAVTVGGVDQLEAPKPIPSNPADPICEMIEWVCKTASQFPGLP